MASVGKLHVLNNCTYGSPARALQFVRLCWKSERYVFYAFYVNPT